MFMGRSELLRKENFQEFTYHLLSAVTEDMLRTLVEEGDPLIFVNPDDGVGSNFDHPGEQ